MSKLLVLVYFILCLFCTFEIVQTQQKVWALQAQVIQIQGALTQIDSYVVGMKQDNDAKPCGCRSIYPPQHVIGK